MPSKPDFQETLQNFIYLNLPVLMNPANAMNVVISNEIVPTNPTAPTVPISSSPAITTAPVLVISPEIVNAIQAYVVNHFPDIGLPSDIQDIAKIFLANLPPLIPVAPNSAITTATQTVTPS